MSYGFPVLFQHELVVVYNIYFVTRKKKRILLLKKEHKFEVLYFFAGDICF